ncbi:hypothetical protein BC941DRAFT_420910 [Chlamydoabsidia padenii]|nr:hypothetical protein BC941DRAFT_420910 [Chlamydoabsidia padenii]
MWKRYRKASYTDSVSGDGNPRSTYRNSKSLEDLEKTLLSLDGRSYGAYNSLKNDVYRGSLFDLMFTFIQGDPYAGSSTFSVYLHPESTNYPPELYSTRIRATAFADYIGRIIETNLQWDPQDGKDGRFDGQVKGGTFSTDSHPQQVLERNDVVVYEGGVDIRLKFSLPAKCRTIVIKKVIHALLIYLPSFIQDFLVASAMDLDKALAFVTCIEDQEWIRSSLRDQGLIAFIPDGAILSRAAGDKDTPNLNRSRLVPFQSPDSLKVSMTLPSGKQIQGMGIPPGITVITGGGYHGKSTLLRALEMGIYNHIPGDGREYLATDKTAVKIRSEDGRWIEGVNISPFIKSLPFGADTTAFSTKNASGSTSMAAGIQEMVECGSKLFLYDEDTCATNFLVSDLRMRQLVTGDHEPIIPLTARIKQLYNDKGVSAIMVTGACFDFLELADLVIEMRNYHAGDVTNEAKRIALNHRSLSSLSNDTTLHDYGPVHSRQLVLPRYMNNCKVSVEKHGHINFKGYSELIINLNDHLVEQAMLLSIKCGLLYLQQLNQPLTINEYTTLLDQLMDRPITKTPIEGLGKEHYSFLESPLDTLFRASPYGHRLCDLSRPPKSTFIYALNRLNGTRLDRP